MVDMAESDVHPWIAEMPLRMQSTLLLSLRGPDTDRHPNVKNVARWLRQLCLIPDPEGPGWDDGTHPTDNFMARQPIDTPEFLKELEFCTIHYVMHLLHGLEIVGWMYPDFPVRQEAWHWYGAMVNDWHLREETHADFMNRLRRRSPVPVPVPFDPSEDEEPF